MPRRPHLLPPPSQSDTDALQADVMRFMAILGLCLTAVFALVKSIPTLPEPPSVAPHTSAENAALVAREQEQAQQAARLSAQLEQMRDLQQRTEAELAASRDLLESTRVEVDRSLEYRERLQAQLDYLGTALAQRRKELKQTPAPAPPPPKPEAPAGTRAKSPTPSAVTSSTAPRTGPAHAKSARPRETGFTLRFASDAALSRLVRGGSVQLLGIAGTRSWLLSLDRSGPRFTPHPFPRSFHEMTPATVPAEYVRALGERSDAPDPAGIVWGVELPADMERRISELLSRAEGGALVIRADGGVGLETSAPSG